MDGYIIYHVTLLENSHWSHMIDTLSIAGPLHVAARVGNLEILNVLVLEYNATVNKQDKVNSISDFITNLFTCVFGLEWIHTINGGIAQWKT